MRRLAKIALFLTVSAVLMVALTACGEDKAVDLEPKIAPPAIQQKGVLLAGVDLSTPPFAGVDEGQRAGIDIDVASAIAGSLGLEVEFVDVKPSEAATALAEGKVDLVLSVPLTTADLARVSSAGTYLYDGPAFFASAEESASAEATLTLDTVRAEKFGAQEESESYWFLQQEFGPQMVEGYDSLRQALAALADDNVEIVAGDALVGSYIAQDFTSVRMVGQLTDAQPLAVVVTPENEALNQAVRETLDEMAAGGVIDAILRKWVPGMPQLRVAEEQATPEQ